MTGLWQIEARKGDPVPINASEAMLEILAEAGLRYLFGNPGTTELPLSDALVDHPRIKYILGLQEVPVVAMADGFAQASGIPGVVNLHISCGLGNGMGMLYNAYRAHLSWSLPDSRTGD
jgi:benzoylformate decarboxylase